MNSGISTHPCIPSHTHTYDNTQNRLINDFYKLNGRKKYVYLFVIYERYRLVTQVQLKQLLYTLTYQLFII